jgi:exonuclease VII small subunit
LLWVLTNRPSGDSVVSWWAREKDKTKVEINFNNGHIVKERQNGRTKYIVNDIDFDCIKQDVPEEVLLLANIEGCNIQSQHESYFLLNDSPGEVARKLNKIVGLDIIDDVYSNLDRRIRNIASSVLQYKAQISRLEKDLEELGDADALYNRAVLLKEKFKVLQDTDREIKELTTLISTILKIEEEIDDLREFTANEKIVDNIFVAMEEYNHKKDNLDRLEKIIYIIEDVNQKIESNLYLIEKGKLTAKITKAINDFLEIKEKVKSLEKIVASIENANIFLEKEVNTKSNLLGSLKALLKKEKICPICNSNLTDSVVDDIVERL